MVQVVVLSANGESRTLKTIAFAASAATGAGIAKALRKVKPAELVGSYTTKTGTKLSVWGWRTGKAGTENKHELPPMGDGADEGLLFGDAVVVSSAGDYTVEQWETFYEEAFGGFESLDSEGEGEDEEEEAVDGSTRRCLCWTLRQMCRCCSFWKSRCCLLSPKWLGYMYFVFFVFFYIQ
jgi:hypothetical protein